MNAVNNLLLTASVRVFFSETRSATKSLRPQRRASVKQDSRKTEKIIDGEGEKEDGEKDGEHHLQKIKEEKGEDRNEEEEEEDNTKVVLDLDEERDAVLDAGPDSNHNEEEQAVCETAGHDSEQVSSAIECVR